MNRLAPLAVLALVACGPKTPLPPPAEEAASAGPTLPGPLAKRPFALPTPTRGTLSNGLRVVVVENHEVPMVYVRMVIDRGAYTDPDDRIGLASAAVGMLDEGAGSLSAAALSREAQRLGASLSSGAGADGASVGLSTLKRTLPESLDLFSTIILEPTFAREDWQLMRKKRIQNLQESKQDPNSISGRVLSKLLFGEAYKGRMATEAGLNAIKTPHLKAWYRDNVAPSTATLLVGGDTTLDEVLPLLEARFGSWTAEATEAQRPTLQPALAAQSGTIYFIDVPGAAQSVVRAGVFVCDELDTDWFAFDLANRTYGGAFTARLNMNLREDKGITYGARSGVGHSYVPGLWSASSSIVTDSTTLGVTELLREIKEMQGDRPITQEELDNARGGLIGTWPLNFENPGYLLGQTNQQVLYGLGDDWLGQQIPRYEAVTLDAANAAFSKYIATDDLVLLVVGDAQKVRSNLAEQTGWPVVNLDADGNVID